MVNLNACRDVKQSETGNYSYINQRIFVTASAFYLQWKSAMFIQYGFLVNKGNITCNSSLILSLRKYKIEALSAVFYRNSVSLHQEAITIEALAWLVCFKKWDSFTDNGNRIFAQKLNIKHFISIILLTRVLTAYLHPPTNLFSFIK